MTCGRVHRVVVDRRLAIPAVIDVLEVAIEEAHQLDTHREVADLAMREAAHPELARIAQVVEGEGRLEAALVEPVAPDKDRYAGTLDHVRVRRRARLLP